MLIVNFKKVPKNGNRQTCKSSRNTICSPNLLIAYFHDHRWNVCKLKWKIGNNSISTFEFIVGYIRKWKNKLCLPVAAKINYLFLNYKYGVLLIGNEKLIIVFIFYKKNHFIIFDALLFYVASSKIWIKLYFFTSAYDFNYILLRN